MSKKFPEKRRQTNEIQTSIKNIFSECEDTDVTLGVIVSEILLVIILI
jgi:hypothetical protein